MKRRRIVYLRERDYTSFVNNPTRKESIRSYAMSANLPSSPSLLYKFKYSNLLLFGIWVTACIFQTASGATNYDFSERPANQSVRIGERLTLRCSAPPSHTKFDSLTQWRTNTGALLSSRDAGVLPGYSGRYSYVKDAPGELYLQIGNVSLVDDGKFECQMLRPNKLLRASAFVNVLVPPTEVSFLNYRPDEPVVVQEDAILNVTCFTAAVKPEPEINIFVNGKKIVESVQRWSQQLENGTVNAFTSLIWHPTKKDHNKLLSCEVNHPMTATNLRSSLSLNVLYSSDRPKIDVVVAGGGSGERLKAGTNVTLICSAEGGNPKPRLLWSNNEAGLFNSSYHYDETTQITRNAYTFITHGMDNEAVYECSSSNREDSAPLKKSITLAVDYASTAVYLYGSTTSKKGESVVISCSSGVSSPASSISWMVNGSPTRTQPQTQKRQAHGFVTESNITVDSNVLLSGQNQIVVECIATNGEGPPASNQHIVRVLSPPSHPIIYEPSEHGSIAFLEGGLLNLTCESQGGHPLATLSWYRGVEKLKEAYGSSEGDVSSSVVSIQLDRSMNQQQVRCDAENGATDQPLVAKKMLTVLFPPSHIKIHQMEGSHQHMVSDVANRLTCNVPSSNPPAEITWEFENQTPAGSPTSKVAKSGQYTKRSNRPTGEYKGYEVENVIQFVPTEEMDKSVVRCIASHPQWSEIKASSFTLDIMYPPRVAVEGPVTIVVGENESFEENLTIHANPRPSNFQWRKNGVVIEHGIGNVVVRGSTISGQSVTKEDSGVYTLNAANRIGTTNVSLRLTVEYSARVTYITSPVIAGVGEDVVLECEADGVPLRQGMVKWRRGDTELKSAVQDQKRAVLRINASHDNSGLYTCVADNGVGRPNSTSAYLLVRRAPVILRTPEFERAAGPLGGRATLKCRAVGVPNVDFSWGIEGDGQMIVYNTSKYKFFDSQLDHSTFQSTLTILNLDERDYSRRYRCRASNRLGLVQSYITVGPPSPPDVPLELQVVNITDTTVSLAWLPGFDGGFSQIFELRYQAVSQSDVKSVNSSGSRILITGLNTEQLYRVQIRSINARGLVSEFSSPALQFHTLDENMQGVYRVVADNVASVLSPPAMFGILLIFVVLLVLNLILVCFCRRRHQRKKYEEKTEIARTLGNGIGRGIQIYGTVDGGCGTPALSSNRRPDSTNTNKSELMNEPLTSEDNQSARTIIEVNPNGYIMANNNNIYDSNCVVDYDVNQDYYSPINKPLLNGTTYAAVPYPEPPHDDHNGIIYASQNNGSRLTLERSPAPHRHIFAQTNGYTSLPTTDTSINNNNNNTNDTLLFFVGQNGVPSGNYLAVNGASYVYNPQTNSLTLTSNNAGEQAVNGYGNGEMSNDNSVSMSYDSLRRNQYQQQQRQLGMNGSLASGNRTPRTLHTFSSGSKNQTGNNDDMLMNTGDFNVSQRQQLLLNGDGIEGDIV